MSIGAIVLAIVTGLAVNERCDVAPWCARKLVRWSAFRRYTDRARAEARAEELAAVINARPGKLFKLITALAFAGGASMALARRSFARLSGRVIDVPYLPPQLVQRYLSPKEVIVRAIRLHPMAVIAPTALILAGAFSAGFVSGSAPRVSAGLVRLVWVLWCLLAAWQGWKVSTWWRSYFVITDNRLMFVTSLLNTYVGMMPLAKVTDIRLYQTRLGRWLGYAHLVVESAGQNQALSRIEYVPFPSQMYRQILSLLSQEKPPALGS